MLNAKLSSHYFTKYGFINRQDVNVCDVMAGKEGIGFGGQGLVWIVQGDDITGPVKSKCEGGIPM